MMTDPDGPTPEQTPPATPPVSEAANPLPEQVQTVIAEAPAPLTFAEVKSRLKDAGVKLSGKSKVSDADIQQALDAPPVFTHPAPSGKGKPKYWHQRPLTAAEQVAATVRAKADALSDDELVAANKLGKPGAKAGPEEAEAFEATLKQLVDEKQLHAHPGGKYGKAQPKWYEAAPHKGDFNKLLTLAKKLIDTGNVSIEQVVSALGERLRSAPAPQPPAAPPTPVAPPHAPPAEPVSQPPEIVSPEDEMDSSTEEESDAPPDETDSPTETEEAVTPPPDDRP